MKKHILNRVIAISLLTLALLSSYLANIGTNVFSVEVLDIGQGDSILIRTPEDVRMLIDGGPRDNVLRALGETLPFGDKRVDVIVSTHPDADHLEGLISVLKRYKVKALLKTTMTTDTAAFKTFTDLLASKDLIIQEINWGDRVDLGNGVEFIMLWPPPGEQAGKTNESSVVGQLRYGGYKFLLTGDIGETTEYKLASYIKEEFLRSQVLKVPHHGSRFSSSGIFLQKVKPRVAAISVGLDNTYGHPTQDALERLGALGSEILRTDLDGTIKLIVDERGMLVKTAK